MRRVWPWCLKSSASADSETSTCGWGGDFLWVQSWDVESQVWWWRVPSTIVSTCSNMALSCSTGCQHIWAVWFCRPQDEHVVPNAGQWMRLWAVRSCSPWPWRPQKLQMPVALGDLLRGCLWPLVEVFLGLGWLYSLVGVWPGGVARVQVGVALPGPGPGRGVGRFCCRL